MSDEGWLVFIALAAFGLGLVVGLGGMASNSAAWRADMVTRGYAMHCPDDGRWAWIGECAK